MGKRGKQLSQTKKEMIVQVFALTGNKSRTAQELGVSRPSVLKVLKEAETNKELQVARKRALDELAGQVHGKTHEILESISPSDLESGRQLFHDEEGRVTRKVEWGPSLLQKVTAAAILTDKVKVIEETKAVLEADPGAGQTGLPLPGTVQESLRLLGAKLKRIRVLDVQFDSKQPELSERLQNTVTEAALHPEVENADYEEISKPITMDDFDNTGENVD